MERVGKIVFALPFLAFSALSIMNWDGTLANTQNAFASMGITSALESAGLPASSLVYASLLFAVFLKAGGGLALVTGGDLCGGAMLATFLAAITPVMHWPIGKDGQMDFGQLVHFLKNLGLFGAAVMLTAQAYRKWTGKGKAKAA